MKTILALIILAFSSITLAEGGKINNPRIVLGPDECVYTIPNTKACELDPAQSHSGIQVYVCDEALVVCVVEKED